ncbi:MAG TPA: TolC family protein [Clostridiales bacterium]|nr:TolC family protein [Clostridiales bacterium]
MRFKILILILAYSLFLTTTVSAEPKFRYSFDEALEMALKNSTEYQSKTNTIYKAYDAFEAAQKAAPKEIKFTGSMRKFISDQVDPIIKVEEAYYNYQQAILDRNNTKTTIALNLRSAVIAVEDAEMDLEEANINREIWEEELALLNLKYDKNLITKSEYENKKADLENKLKDLNKYQDNLDEAYYKLNSLLGRENEKDITVILDDTVVPLEKLDLDQIKKDMMKRDYALVQKNNERYIKKYYFDLVEERYLKYDLDRFTDSMRDEITEMYEEAKENFETADKNYKKALETFEREFEQMIKDIDKNIEEINEIKQKIIEEQQKAEVNKLKYEARMISKSQYNTSLNRIILLKNDLKSAELQLNLKYAKLLAYSELNKVVKE